MATTSLPTPSLSPEAEFRVPGPNDQPGPFLDRWSNRYLSLPAATAIPRTEEDIVQLVRYASQHSLVLLASGGKHGSSVPIGPKTLYVDLRRLDAIELDESESEGQATVRVGGGVQTGQLNAVLGPKGYFSSLPSVNGVGVVGALLGGGGSGIIGVAGYLVDHLVSARVVTADGQVRDLSGSSTGDEARLWDALRGAGSGLGVVVSVTLRLLRGADLGLQDGNKAWSRMLMFPGSSPDTVRTAAAAYERLQPARGPVSALLILAHGPPGTPAAGKPVVLLVANYMGPAAEAERALAVLFEDGVVAASAMQRAGPVPLERMNDGAAALEAHGDLKKGDSTALLRPVIAAHTIERAFARYVALTSTEAPDAARGSQVVFSAWDPSLAISSASARTKTDFFEHVRPATAACFTYSWWTDPASSPAIDAYHQDLRAIVRDGEQGEPRRLPSNLGLPAALAESYTSHRLAQLAAVRKLWDPAGVFWKLGDGPESSQA